MHYHNGKTYHLLDYHRPDEGQYIILESFTNTPHKTIHVISFDDETAEKNKHIEFSIGRDTNVNIRITDISVSRVHSKLIFHNGDFYIRDEDSKFGTLVLLQSPIEIPYKPKFVVTMQIGKYLITAEPQIQNSTL